MEKMLFNFDAFALTRQKMKSVIGGEKCMPAHWDLIIYNGQGKNGGPQHIACYTNQKAANKAKHSTQYGSYARNVLEMLEIASLLIPTD